MIILFRKSEKHVNVGDNGVVDLIKRLCKYENFQFEDIEKVKNKDEAAVVVSGSILQRLKVPAIIWSTGLISNRPLGNLESKAVKNSEFLSVRGPLTRRELLKDGISVPEVYGDAFLMSRLLYIPKKPLKYYKIGIVPHYNDLNSETFKEMCSTLTSFKVIETNTDNVQKFIDELHECDIIISSSLHGIIISASFRIPVIWYQFSNNLETFKFYDFFASINKDPHKRLILTKEELRNAIIPVINSCPLISRDRKHELYDYLLMNLQ